MSITKTSTNEVKQAPAVVAPKKEAYFLPEYGVSVQATSVDDAVAQAEKLTAAKSAKKEGDDNL